MNKEKKKNYQLRFFLTIIFLLIVLILFSIYNIIFIGKNVNKIFQVENKANQLLIKFKVEEFEKLNLNN